VLVDSKVVTAKNKFLFYRDIFLSDKKKKALDSAFFIACGLPFNHYYQFINMNI